MYLFDFGSGSFNEEMRKQVLFLLNEWYIRVFEMNRDVPSAAQTEWKQILQVWTNLLSSRVLISSFDDKLVTLSSIRSGNEIVLKYKQEMVDFAYYHLRPFYWLDFARKEIDSPERDMARIRAVGPQVLWACKHVGGSRALSVLCTDIEQELFEIISANDDTTRAILVSLGLPAEEHERLVLADVKGRLTSQVEDYQDLFLVSQFSYESPHTKKISALRYRQLYLKAVENIVEETREEYALISSIEWKKTFRLTKELLGVLSARCVFNDAIRFDAALKINPDYVFPYLDSEKSVKVIGYTSLLPDITPRVLSPAEMHTLLSRFKQFFVARIREEWKDDLANPPQRAEIITLYESAWDVWINHDELNDGVFDRIIEQLERLKIPSTRSVVDAIIKQIGEKISMNYAIQLAQEKIDSLAQSDRKIQASEMVKIEELFILGCRGTKDRVHMCPLLKDEMIELDERVEFSSTSSSSRVSSPTQGQESVSKADLVSVSLREESLPQKVSHPHVVARMLKKESSFPEHIV